MFLLTQSGRYLNKKWCCERCFNYTVHARAGKSPTPAKAPPLSRIIHVPPCTADLSLHTRGKAFLLYVEGGGASSF
jgi:hypothetical protein